MSADKGGTADLDKVRSEIAATRAALAETTAALSVKADVKTRATAAAKANQTVLAAVAGAVALLVALRTWQQRRKSGTKRKKK